MVGKIQIAHLKNDFSINKLNDKAWKQANEVLINKYWSGENAPIGRQFRAKLLWSDSALYIYFEANQTEPLMISEKPNLKTKTRELWDRDVCEVFVAPNAQDFRHYYEFEVAPTGEWIDLKIYQMPEERETDFEYDSEMQTAAQIKTGKVLMAMKIEWKAFGAMPKVGDIWKGNLFRCVGAGVTRGYLVWSPTKTAMPNFHVPEAFGEFEFIK